MASDTKVMPSPKWSKKHQIGINVYLLQPVFAEETLQALHTIMLEHLPVWSSDLRAAEHEDAKRTTLVTKDNELSAAIEHVAPLRPGFLVGSAVLKGAHKGLTFYLNHCKTTLPPDLN